ncbi:MAG: Gfo/Idh/MocA family oxidoreductase [Rhodospirillales bacterium]|nr:Gfo/Idh/MocA family oxidoreductase [Rhodospirillales bacterium]
MSAASKNIRLGLIGAGPWGRNYIKTIGALEGVTLSRLASSNPESRDLVASTCVISPDWRDALKTGDIDGVIIATPPATHAEVMLEAINIGLPVLAEKPMTMSAVDAKAVLAAADSKDSIVLIDHIHLYSAAWEALKREAKALGPLRAISAVAGNWGPFRPDTPMLWDWGSHDIAMCLDLIGQTPDRAEARGIEDRETADGRGQTLALELGFGDVTARIALSNLHPQKERLFTASFQGGELVYDDTADDKLRLKTAPGDFGRAPKLGPGTPLERIVRAFAGAIAAGQPATADAGLGADVVRVLEQLEPKTIN